MTGPDLLAEAIARSWVGNPPLTPSAANDLAPMLLHSLRQLESATAADARLIEAEILSALLPLPQFEQRVREELDALRLENERGTAGSAVDVAHRAKHYRHSLVEVGYATNRQGTRKHDNKDWYDGARGELSFGIVQVSIPDDHRMGRLDKPRAWGLGFREDRRRHIRVVDLAPADPMSIAHNMTTIIQRAPEPEILIFIHGYNVSFADAATRTAQIAYDIDFKGTPFLFSWPSDASTLRYISDGENAQWSQQDFSTFLKLALTSFGSTRVHALAHSMGNRLLTEALASEDFAALPTGSARLGQIIFAAPDVDSAVFIQRARRFAGQADHYTLYVSDKDWALATSRRIAKYPRAGQAGSAIVIVDGIDTIDASDLDTGLMSHSYVGSHRSLISDLHYLINHGDPPDSRFGLTQVATPTGTHWAFRR
jgi:esterase/lipase superfamily enzyme